MSKYSIDLKQGDCKNLLATIPDKTIDLVVTDPPYIIETKGAGIYKTADKKYIHELEGMKDGYSSEILDELCRVMKQINCYFFCSQKQIIPLLDYFVKNKKCNYNILSWHKSNPVPACGNKYLTDTEYILFFREKGVKVRGNYSTKSTYYTTTKNQSDKRLYKHPTVKPLNIVTNLIVNSSDVNDVILDPFSGSGTTAVACINTQRNFIGMEINPEYYNIAKQRIDNTLNSK